MSRLRVKGRGGAEKGEGERICTLNILGLSIILYRGIDDSLSDAKARIIDENADPTLNVLQVVGSSLAIDSPRYGYELKNKLIPAVRRKSGKVIHVNNKSPPRAFFKPMVDYIFELNCDYWVRALAARESSFRDDEAGRSSQHLSCGFAFQPRAKIVDEVIKEAELKLIFYWCLFRYAIQDKNKGRSERRLASLSPLKLAFDVPAHVCLIAFQVGRIYDSPT